MDELVTNRFLKPIAFILLLTTFISCNSDDYPVDKDKIIGADFRIFQETPAWDLAKAVYRENENKIKHFIVDERVDVNYQEPKYGHTVLIQAVLNGQYKSCKTLLELGADPNLHDTQYGNSAIIYAAQLPTGNSNVLKLLLEYHANSNDEATGDTSLKDVTRSTPLIAACQNSLEMTKILVEAGADVNRKNQYNHTALGMAAQTDNLDIVLYLLQKGADHKVVVSHIEGKDYYLLDELRFELFTLGSKKHRQKMAIVEFLQTKGIDYRKTPIPESAIEEAKKSYPNNWHDYLLKY